MLRTVIAVIASIVALYTGVMLLFLGAMLALGLEGTLRPASYWTSATFNLTVFLGGAVLALGAGALSGLIGRSMKPAWILAGIMLAMGALGAVRNLNKPEPPARPGPNDGESRSEYTARVMQDLRRVGKEPVWFSFCVPVMSAGAVVLGAWLVVRGRAGGVGGAADG